MESQSAGTAAGTNAPADPAPSTATLAPTPSTATRPVRGRVWLERTDGRLLARTGRAPSTPGPAPTEPGVVLLAGAGERANSALRALDDEFLTDLRAELAAETARSETELREVRLLVDHGARRGQDGSAPLADRLARALDIPVTAADGPVVEAGAAQVFSAGTGCVWWLFTPGRAARPLGPRLPEPIWQADLLAEVPDRSLGRAVRAVPSGLWVRAAGSPPADLDDLAFSRPANRARLSLLVGRPGEVPPTAPELAEVVRALPEPLRENAVLRAYGPEAAEGALAEELAGLVTDDEPEVRWGRGLAVPGVDPDAEDEPDDEVADLAAEVAEDAEFAPGPEALRPEAEPAPSPTPPSPEPENRLSGPMLSATVPQAGVPVAVPSRPAVRPQVVVIWDGTVQVRPPSERQPVSPPEPEQPVVDEFPVAATQPVADEDQQQPVVDQFPAAPQPVADESPAPPVVDQFPVAAPRQVIDEDPEEPVADQFLVAPQPVVDEFPVAAPQQVTDEDREQSVVDDFPVATTQPVVDQVAVATPQPVVDEFPAATPQSATPRWLPVPAADEIVIPLSRLVSTAAERQAFRLSLGWRYDAASQYVTRLLSQRPGLRAVADEGVDTDLAAVQVFASGADVPDPADGEPRPEERAFLSCVVGGLKRLPALNGPVVRGGPDDPAAADSYVPGTRVVQTGPLLAVADTTATLPGAVEVLIWSNTARRLDGLLEAAQAETVVFLPGTVFQVLDVDTESEPRRVLLLEAPASWRDQPDPARDERISVRLRAVAEARKQGPPPQAPDPDDDGPGPADWNTPRFSGLPGMRSMPAGASRLGGAA